LEVLEAKLPERHNIVLVGLIIITILLLI